MRWSHRRAVPAVPRPLIGVPTPLPATVRAYRVQTLPAQARCRKRLLRRQLLARMPQEMARKKEMPRDQENTRRSRRATRRWMDRRVKTVRARLASPCTCDAQPIVRVRQIAPARPRFVLSPAFRAVAHVAYGAPRLARRRDRRAVDGVLAWVDDRPRVSRTCGVADTPLQCHDALRQRGRSELSFVDDCISQPCGKLARVRQARAHANKLRQAASRAGIAPCTLHPTAALVAVLCASRSWGALCCAS